jgi:hypothetical protein
MRKKCRLPVLFSEIDDIEIGKFRMKLFKMQQINKYINIFFFVSIFHAKTVLTTYSILS